MAEEIEHINNKVSFRKRVAFSRLAVYAMMVRFIDWTVIYTARKLFYENRPWNFSIILSMKKLSSPAYYIFVLFSTVNLLITVSPSFAVTTDKVLATVGEEVITMTDYQHFAEVIVGTEGADVVDRKLLDRLIEDKIIRHAAARRGIEVADSEVEKEVEAFRKQNFLSQEDLERALSDEGMTFEDYKKGIAEKIRAMKLFNLEVRSKVFVAEKEIDDYYSDHKNDYLISHEKVEIKSVLLRLRQDASVNEITELKMEAMRMATEIQEGGSFEKIINTQKALKGQTGSESASGEFRRGSLVPAVDKEAFSMKKGETSGPIWVGDGVYIIKVLNRTDESFKPVKDVRKDIYSKIYEQKTENNFNEWVRTLWEKTSVKIH